MYANEEQEVIQGDIFSASQIIYELLGEYPYRPDENELTRRFLQEITKNRRVYDYRFSQKEEAITGSDWLWLVMTELAVFFF